jgi:hypothetical protein
MSAVSPAPAPSGTASACSFRSVRSSRQLQADDHPEQTMRRSFADEEDHALAGIVSVASLEEEDDEHEHGEHTADALEAALAARALARQRTSIVLSRCSSGDTHHSSAAGEGAPPRFMPLFRSMTSMTRAPSTPPPPFPQQPVHEPHSISLATREARRDRLLRELDEHAARQIDELLTTPHTARGPDASADSAAAAASTAWWDELLRGDSRDAAAAERSMGCVTARALGERGEQGMAGHWETGSSCMHATRAAEAARGLCTDQSAAGRPSALLQWKKEVTVLRLPPVGGMVEPHGRRPGPRRAGGARALAAALRSEDAAQARRLSAPDAEGLRVPVRQAPLAATVGGVAARRSSL